MRLYIILLLCAGWLFQSCKQEAKTYNLTRGHIDTCERHMGECKPILLNRAYKDQQLVITMSNPFKRSSLDSEELALIKKGAPVISLDLCDFEQARRVGYGKIPWDSLAIIRKASAGIGQDISLDLSGIPDGKYSLLYSIILGEFPSDFTVFIKTD